MNSLGNVLSLSGSGQGGSQVGSLSPNLGSLNMSGNLPGGLSLVGMGHTPNNVSGNVNMGQSLGSLASNVNLGQTLMGMPNNSSLMGNNMNNPSQNLSSALAAALNPNLSGTTSPTLVDLSKGGAKSPKKPKMRRTNKFGREYEWGKNCESLWETVRRLKEKNNWTQKKIADELGVWPKTVQKILARQKAGEKYPRKHGNPKRKKISGDKSEDEKKKQDSPPLGLQSNEISNGQGTGSEILKNDGKEKEKDKDGSDTPVKRQRRGGGRGRSKMPVKPIIPPQFSYLGPMASHVLAQLAAGFPAGYPFPIAPNFPYPTLPLPPLPKAGSDNSLLMSSLPMSLPTLPPGSLSNLKGGEAFLASLGLSGLPGTNMITTTSPGNTLHVGAIGNSILEEIDSDKSRKGNNKSQMPKSKGREEEDETLVDMSLEGQKEKENPEKQGTVHLMDTSMIEDDRLKLGEKRGPISLVDDSGVKRVAASGLLNL